MACGYIFLYINQAHQQVTNRAARQGQIEAQRFEGGVHSKTMDDDGESICRSRSKLVVTCLCAWLIIDSQEVSLQGSDELTYSPMKYR